MKLWRGVPVIVALTLTPVVARANVIAMTCQTISYTSPDGGATCADGDSSGECGPTSLYVDLTGKRVHLGDQPWVPATVDATSIRWSTASGNLAMTGTLDRYSLELDTLVTYGSTSMSVTSACKKESARQI